MKKIDTIIKRLVKGYAGEIILDYLASLSAENLEKGIKENISLIETLQKPENREKYRSLRKLALAIPFANKITETITDIKWIKFFVKNEIAHKRPDLYPIIAYNPKAIPYIQAQIQDFCNHFLRQS